ncbi:YueI family protein [Falsibacillus albus]|uniref:YueI family protein n=1 Tax=Falsibacillus albus TaxID=2478915 RepID=UPI001F357E40|nr:YueI family protein [Falsibacillus albus]
MDRTSVDDYIQNGIYGEKQTKPGERKKFLGTIRERVVVALTKRQIRERKVLNELEGIMRNHKKAKLLLNGEMDYTYLSPFIKLSNKYEIPFSIVNDAQTTTEIGLVLAYDHAVDIEQIYIESDIAKVESSEQKKNKKKNNSLFGKLFRKKRSR